MPCCCCVAEPSLDDADSEVVVFTNTEQLNQTMAAVTATLERADS